MGQFQPTQPAPQQITPEMKQKIGDTIYQMILPKYQDSSAKIVGVLLDTPQVNTMRLAQDPAYLMEVAEQVFINFQRQAQQAPQNAPTQQ